jgi:hypothetical protein
VKDGKNPQKPVGVGGGRGYFQFKKQQKNIKIARQSLETIQNYQKHAKNDEKQPE